MKPSELYFCLHTGDVLEDDKGLILITLCPIDYWKQHECLPDYWFADKLEGHLPKGYKWYIGSEETIWCARKSKEEVRTDMITLEFVECPEMEKFLSDCWG